jgi:hypothetical protein
VTRPALTWLALWLGIASAVAVGIVAGFLILRLVIPDVAIAASRSGSPSLDANAVSDLVLAPANETPNPSPMRRVALPPATASPSPASIVLAARSGTRVVGTASTYGPAFGPGWLALPEGAGVRVRVCGAATCIERISTDAGPDLAMQRLGRIVDLSVRDFELVCGVPWTRGLCQVEVSW